MVWLEPALRWLASDSNHWLAVFPSVGCCVKALLFTAAYVIRNLGRHGTEGPRCAEVKRDS
jgi:hypothetical protein